MDLPICTYEDAPVPIDFCPGDSWGAADGCNSCACTDDGRILCSSIVCGAE